MTATARPKRSSRYWRNIAVITGLALIIGGIAITIFLVVSTISFATAAGPGRCTG